MAAKSAPALEGCQFGDEPVNQGIPTLVRNEFEQLGDIDAVNDDFRSGKALVTTVKITHDAPVIICGGLRPKATDNSDLFHGFPD